VIVSRAAGNGSRYVFNIDGRNAVSENDLRDAAAYIQDFHAPSDEKKKHLRAIRDRLSRIVQPSDRVLRNNR